MADPVLNVMYDSLGFSSAPCPSYSPIFGILGAALGLFFANCGAAYGIAISFDGYLKLGTMPRVDRVMLIKGLIPAVMSSVRGVYGLIIAILISVEIKVDDYPLYKSFAHFYAGLCVGLSGYASGYCMGILGDHGMRAVAKKPRLYMSVLLMIIFAEAIGLYGLIIALIVLTNGGASHCKVG